MAPRPPHRLRCPAHSHGKRGAKPSEQAARLRRRTTNPASLDAKPRRSHARAPHTWRDASGVVRAPPVRWVGARAPRARGQIELETIGAAPALVTPLAFRPSLSAFTPPVSRFSSSSSSSSSFLLIPQASAHRLSSSSLELRFASKMGRDERQPQRRSQEPEVEEGGRMGAVGGGCDYCVGAEAVVYCRADTARLCLPCDRHVHGANAVCSRHARAPLCAACRAAAAVFRRAAAEFLCSNCDYARHRGGRHGGADELLHDRCAVQGYTGCPSAHELAALLGVPEFEKPAAAADEGWWNIWEEPQVLSLEDIIVPTTSCHGFQPLVTPPSPKLGKNQSSPDGKTNEEVIRQLGELAESDCGVQIAAHEEAEQAGDQFSLLAPSEYITGHGDFGAEKSSHEVATMPTPGYENGKWNDADYHALNDACKAEFAYEHVPVSSAEACLSSFVQMSEICPSLSNGNSTEDNHQANPGIGMQMQALPKKGGIDVVPCPDRGSVISRYKEKRKTRRFGKQVRYESRKVRADGRLRIKGRFAKANQI